jgi:hypothetical protein
MPNSLIPFPDTIGRFARRAGKASDISGSWRILLFE